MRFFLWKIQKRYRFCTWLHPSPLFPPSAPLSLSLCLYSVPRLAMLIPAYSISPVLCSRFISLQLYMRRGAFFYLTYSSVHSPSTSWSATRSISDAKSYKLFKLVGIEFFQEVAPANPRPIHPQLVPPKFETHVIKLCTRKTVFLLMHRQQRYFPPSFIRREPSLNYVSTACLNFSSEYRSNFSLFRLPILWKIHAHSFNVNFIEKKTQFHIRNLQPN